MKITALILDFDGTLAELNLDFMAMAAEVQGLAREMGLGDPWPVGMLLEVIDQVGAELGQDFVAQAHELLRARELAGARQGRMFPYSKGLLAEARELGLSTAIISRNCRDAISLVFPKVESACDVFLPREAVARPKPHPDHARAALSGLGVAAEHAVVVGDHPSDVVCGLAAGCRTVGVASGRMSMGDLRKAGAHLVLEHAGDLLAELGLDGDGKE